MCLWSARTFSQAMCFFFFFQAEDGIRDLIVTGVQTCALPIFAPYRTSTVPLDSVARALGVGTIVRGNVDEAGARYRVSVNLIDGASGADLGKRVSFEHPAGAVLAIRDSLASKVAEVLRVRLGEELRLRQEQTSTHSVAAWSLVQQGERDRKDAEARLVGDDMDGAFVGFARADSLLALAEAADPSWAEPM